MWQALFAHNTIVSRRPLALLALLALFAFVAIANVATGTAKSFEALDFGENSVVASSQSNAKLVHLSQNKCAGCNSNSDSKNNNDGFYNLTSVAVMANTGQLLSRRKRFLAFPVGSSFACTICLTTGVIGNPNYQYLSMGLNWGIAYDLPNATWVLDHANALGRKKGEKDMEKQAIKRRHRRDLYHKVETIISSTLAKRAAPAISATTTTIEATNATHITAVAAAKSETSALQTQWQRILSRRKRYLAFPEGTSFTVSACITIGIIGNPNDGYMSFGLNWGVAYDLPNTTWVLNQLHGLSRRPRPMVVRHRRSKRALYERIAEAVDNMGYSGRDCVLRALCESRQYFARTKMGMIGEILRVIFSLPKQRIFSRELRENSDIAIYDHAYRKARSLDCATQYDCPFSLLELAFGTYSKPYADYYGNTGM